MRQKELNSKPCDPLSDNTTTEMFDSSTLDSHEMSFDFARVLTGFAWRYQTLSPGIHHLKRASQNIHSSDGLLRSDQTRKTPRYKEMIITINKMEK